MSLKRITSSMLWAGARGAGCLLLLASCGGDDLRCGDGTFEQQDVCVPSPVEPAPHDTSLTITSLEFPEGPVHENHLMKARVGFKSQGDGEHFTLSLGLMEAPPTQGELPANLSSCLLGGQHLFVHGEDTEQFVDLEFTVGHECVQGKLHNFFVSSSFEKPSGELTGQTLVFSAREASQEQHRQCQKPNGEAGCVYNVEVLASPGLDAHVTEVTPSSRVAVVYPVTQTVHPVPMLAVGTDVALHGRDRHGAAEVPEGPLYLTYSIAPFQGDTTDWQPLDLSDVHDETVTTHYPIPHILPHEPLHVSNHLHVTPAVQNKLQGDWARVNVFNLRACVESSFDQDGGGLHHTGGEDGTANDCYVFNVQLVRASATVSAQQASTQSWSYAWGQNYGGDKLGLTPSFNTFNVIDLSGSEIPQAAGSPQQGAMASVNGQANLTGQYVGALANTPLFQGTARAVAYVAVNNSFASVSVNAFGVNLYGVNRTVNIPNPIYDQDWNAMKEKCQNSTYVVFTIPVTLGFCGSGTIGLTAQLNIGNSGVAGQTGQGGQVKGTAKPYASLMGSASASLGIPGFSIGVQGNLTLLDASAPLTSTLNWGLTGLTPMSMDINGNTTWAVQLTSLSGAISLVVTYPSANWCAGWWDVQYPCGPWTGTYTDTLYAFDGLTWTNTLLNANQALALSR